VGGLRNIESENKIKRYIIYLLYSRIIGLDVTVIDLREKFSIAGDRSAGNGGKWGKICER